ncbi:Protein of unknown function DUF2934 [Gemmatirosa kalamazoonensis]|uniref:DUF2934 domain-containing protein n=1 Tax=Gemmatirosa kalamazoonensis TaxID=861299 RepID=W0RMF2_9BACT|nr:DUF2934 domain-containing protein [Gemmatirosa kalamazoonensis]AHG91647.1 Protein of unknown function DUF2934 [Gemmatirosa kalamazoonensis]
MEHSGEASRSGAPADAGTGARSGEDKAGRERGHGLLDRIRQRAYELFVARGGRHGNDMEDWLTAERELYRPPEMPGLADRVTADAGVLGAPSATDTPTAATPRSTAGGTAAKTARTKTATAKTAAKTGATKSATPAKTAAKAAAPKPAAPKPAATKPAATKAATPKPAAAKQAAAKSPSPSPATNGNPASAPSSKEAPRRKPRGPGDGSAGDASA